MLNIKNIGKTFQGPEGDVHAVTKVTLSIAKGELTAIQGSSGSGKTTLLLMAGGLLKPTEGTISLGEQNIYDLDPKQRSFFRARKIGFVFQQFHLIPYLTVYDNILSPSGAYHQDHAKHRAEELIKHFKLEHRANHLPSQLSTGERQRAALARALLNNPDVILADEPTGNLDNKNASIVLGYLGEFARNGGSVLIVTHDVRVTENAKRVLHMEAGRIAAQ